MPCQKLTTSSIFVQSLYRQMIVDMEVAEKYDKSIYMSLKLLLYHGTFD